MKCKYCNYEWQPRKDNPASCPSCKNRLDRTPRVVGLQIGGTVSPMDRVGMHVSMPVNPGIGVKVELAPQFDQELKEIAKKIAAENTPQSEKLKKLIKKTLKENDMGKKLQKINTIVMISAGIIKIAEHTAKLSKLLGF